MLGFFFFEIVNYVNWINSKIKLLQMYIICIIYIYKYVYAVYTKRVFVINYTKILCEILPLLLTSLSIFFTDSILIARIF